MTRIILGELEDKPLPSAARSKFPNTLRVQSRSGHVCIIVNVASKCGLTATNYKELVELHEKYGETKGLKILGFPCNQFSGQFKADLNPYVQVRILINHTYNPRGDSVEVFIRVHRGQEGPGYATVGSELEKPDEEPGSSEDIVCFAVERKVKFDLFEKVDVNGDNAHPLWKYLKHKQGGTLGDFIKWNFTKFIIDKNGQPVERHGPKTDPSKLVSSLEKYW
uniref:Glutathione peroxidase n=1 Tax=Timema monikensis TaxID=170555 RepID=A0A7R9EJ38_9NEOP|nr:unnamed protein product [Timema monikensis]